MPQAIDLVIKNAAGTDKTFSLITPAAGYGSLATWYLKEGAISSVFPQLTALARPSQKKVVGKAQQSSSAQHLSIRFRMPSSFVDTGSGLTFAGATWEMNVNVVVPNAYPESLKADAAAYATNALRTALLLSMMKDGTPAT